MQGEGREVLDATVRGALEVFAKVRYTTLLETAQDVVWPGPARKSRVVKRGVAAGLPQYCESLVRLAPFSRTGPL